MNHDVMIHNIYCYICTMIYMMIAFLGSLDSARGDKVFPEVYSIVAINF